MKIQPTMTRAARPKSLALLPQTERLTFRERLVSETDSSTDGSDSGVVIISDCSLPNSAGPTSPVCESSTNRALDFPTLPSSPANSASTLIEERSRISQISSTTLSIAGSDKTLTKEQEWKSKHAPINGSTGSSSLSNLSISARETESSVTLSIKSLNEPAANIEIRVPSIHDFVLCTRHELSRKYFCLSCEEDICPVCMDEKHRNHKVYKSVTCYYLLSRAEFIQKQMHVNMNVMKKVTSRLQNFLCYLLQGAMNWLDTIGGSRSKLDQLEIDFISHLECLHSIQKEADRDLVTFLRMINGLRILYNNDHLIEMHHSAIHVRCVLVNLHCANNRLSEAVTKAILAETNGRSTLAEIIKSSGMEMLTHTPISSLLKSDMPRKSLSNEGQESSPIFAYPSNLQPDIQPASNTFFGGHGVLSPTICESFTYAREDSIASASGFQLSSKQNQEQMAQLDAINQLLSPECSAWPEVNTFECKWEPRTPQPQPSTSVTSWMPLTPQPQHPHFGGQFSGSSMLKSQSAVSLWEQKQLPRPSVPRRVPLPLPVPVQQQLQAPQLPRAANGGVFEIGYHTARNYNQIRMPVLILEGRYQDDPATLCRPWGICWDKNNRIYVADRSHDRIAVYRADGRFLYAFGNKGDGPGEFNRPAGLAIDFEGRLVVADKDNHRIQVFKPNGEYLFFFGKYGNHHGQFFYPWDVACSSNGHIAVTDTRNHRVQIFTSSGGFIKKFGWESRPSMLKELDQPRGVVFVKPNELLVTDFNNHRIIKIIFGERVFMDQFNEIILPQSLINRPQGLAIDAEGNILVCDSKNDRIVVFTSKGKFFGEFGKRGKEAGQFDRPVDLSVAPDGRIAVVDMNNARVQIF